MTADTLHIRCGCYLQPLFAQSLKHLQVKWRYMLVLVPWSPPFLTDQPRSRSSQLPCPAGEPWEPLLYKSVLHCRDIRCVWGHLECETSDWQTEKDSRENMSSQPLFSSVVQQVHPLPSGQECEESGAGGQEEQARKGKLKNQKKKVVYV